MEYPDLFEVETSGQAYEEDVEITGFGLAPVKPEGGSVIYDSETQGPVTRYTHVAYGLGFIVTHEELKDNLYEVVAKRRAKALAFSMNQTKETVPANVYNRGFSSGYTFGDGKAMLVIDHPTLSGDQSNILANAADFSETALEDLLIQIMKTTNNRGLKINLMGRSLHVAADSWFEANRVLKSVLQNDTANNAINVLKSTNALPEGIKINHYFTDSDAWMVRTNCPTGQMMYKREATSFTQDNDFDTDNEKAKCYMRFSVGSTDFRGVFASPGV